MNHSVGPPRFLFKVSQVTSSKKRQIAIVEGEVLTGRVRVGDALAVTYRNHDVSLTVRQVALGANQLFGTMTLASNDEELPSAYLAPGKLLKAKPR